MPKDKTATLSGVPAIVDASGVVISDAVSRNGIAVEPHPAPPVGRDPGTVFTKEDFLNLQDDRDLTPSLAGEDEDVGFIPIRSPGKAFITICPLPGYEMFGAFVPDFRKSDPKANQHLVLRPMWSRFHGLLRIKRLLLAMSYTDETQHPFLWLCDWYERGETPTELHQSISRVLVKARHNWGQAVYDRTSNGYRWLKWPMGMGVEPVALWPERDFYEIVSESLHGRVIGTPDHELVLCVGEEQP